MDLLSHYFLSDPRMTTPTAPKISLDIHYSLTQDDQWFDSLFA